MRFLIVSNRLPFTITKKAGEFTFTESVGGLATGIKSILAGKRNLESLWIGWPGISVPADQADSFRKIATEKYKAFPVFFPDAKMKSFYHGFCNSTLWALFHYFPSYVVYDEQTYRDYVEINRQMADAVLSVLKKDDILWIHDFHLMLLPELIRRKAPEARIGFFLHIPFPAYELFRLLPPRWGEAILSGLLGSDVIGFHTNDYARYFLRSCLRILGLENEAGRILYKNRAIKVDSFPMGIDYKKFHESYKHAQSQKEEIQFRLGQEDRKFILSIDRLDYSKGIAQRLRAFAAFLENSPKWRKKVKLILIVVPSRTEVPKYQELKAEIDGLAGSINGRFGDTEWTPVVYMYKAMQFHALTALYRACDVALITPLRDGMNLIAKEYIASREDKTGVLILSDMAGAARELGEALLINPNDISGTSQAIKEALEMPIDEQKARMEVMQERLQRYDIFRWADEFVVSLSDWKQEQEKLDIHLLDSKVEKAIISEWKKARSRLILTDYDGTLAPFHSMPQLAKPHKQVRAILKSLAGQSDVVVISGRNRSTLVEWLGDLPISLVAEHGAFQRSINEDWITQPTIKPDWKVPIKQLLYNIADRTPGSFIEEKEFSLVWHFRNAELESARESEKELLDTLPHYTARGELQTLRGHRVVEVRVAGINKGASSQRFFSKKDYDFVLAIGDDWTDEEMFASLPDTAWTIRIGLTATRARHSLEDQPAAVTLLDRIAKS